MLSFDISEDDETPKSKLNLNSKAFNVSNDNISKPPPGLAKQNSTPISSKYVSMMSPTTVGNQFDPNIL